MKNEKRSDESTRKLLETLVLSYNKHLKDVVSSMTLIELLNNAHPSYRKEYAEKLGVKLDKQK